MKTAGMPPTWSDRWHGRFPPAFFGSTGFAAAGFALRIADWTLDPGVIVFIVIPVMLLAWAALLAALFLPLAFASAIVGAVLDAAQRRLERG